MDLDPGPVTGDRGTYLEHVCAEDLLAARGKFVGVVLHERGPTGLAAADRLDRVHHHGGLPVALTAEAAAVSRCTASPGSCRRPPRSWKLVVNAPKPPSARKCRNPASIRAP